MNGIHIITISDINIVYHKVEVNKNKIYINDNLYYFLSKIYLYVCYIEDNYLTTIKIYVYISMINMIFIDLYLYVIIVFRRNYYIQRKSMIKYNSIFIFIFILIIIIIILKYSIRKVIDKRF